MAQIPAQSMVVVGTGEGARLFRNTGDTQDINLKFIGNLEPGSLADEGPSGKSPPDQSDKESMEATFSKQLAAHLYKFAHSGEAAHIVLVLDPDTMGEVRPLLHKEVKDRLVLEMTKSLTNNTVDDIEKSITSA